MYSGCLERWSGVFGSLKERIYDIYEPVSMGARPVDKRDPLRRSSLHGVGTLRCAPHLNLSAHQREEFSWFWSLSAR